MADDGSAKDLVMAQVLARAEVMGQPLDEQCMSAISQLNDDQMQYLHVEFQNRLARTDNPIRNINAMLLSQARGLASGRIPVTERAVREKRPPLAAPRLAAPRQPPAAAPQARDRGQGPGPGAGELLEECGIQNVDAQAVAKIDELTEEAQLDLVAQFEQANSENPIVNPSKWLFSHARSMLCQQAQTRKEVVHERGTAGSGGEHELADLPGVLLDNECIDKLSELDPEEQHGLFELFQQENEHTEIRNPSGWLFAKARTIIVQRITGVKRSSPSGLTRPPATKFEPDRLDALSQIGVDDQAIQKLRELGPDDLLQLLTQFHQLRNAGEVNDASKWLFSKARTIAASRSQKQAAWRQQHQGPSPAAPVPAAIRYDVPASRHQKGGAPVKKGTVPELQDVELDETALNKLQELQAEERDQLFIEYFAESARRPIQNPSGWVFGRARTKVTDRILGRTPTVRSAPY